MEKIKLYLFAIIIGLGFSACDPGEEPIEYVEETPEGPGSVQQTTIEQGSNYNTQVWFSLTNSEVIYSNDKYIWNLEFASINNGGFVKVNGATFMTVAQTNSTDFNASYSAGDYSFYGDPQSGNPDSLKIGYPANVVDQVFLVHLGTDNEGNPLDYLKIQFTAVYQDHVEFQWSVLGESTVNTVSVSLNQTERTIYSFTSNSVLDQFPNSEEWDLCFTQYTRWYPDPAFQFDYLVNGVLSNMDRIQVAEVFDMPFDSISIETAESLNYSIDRNTIGFDWKYYSFDSQLYEILDYRNYVVQTAEGNYYKLHFIDFYSTQGEAGYPLMEWQKL